MLCLFCREEKGGSEMEGGLAHHTNEALKLDGLALGSHSQFVPPHSKEGMPQQLQAKKFHPQAASWCRNQGCLPENGSCLIPEAASWPVSQQDAHSLYVGK